MVFEHLQGCCSLMRVTAVNLTVQWSRRQQRRVLPELAAFICNDLDPLVRSAAIKSTAQFFTALDPDLQLQYIQALAEAIDKDPDPLVRSAAINATAQLQYHRLVLPTLAKAIYADPDPLVRSAAINAAAQFSTALDPDLQLQYIQALAEAIYKDPDPLVRSAAINAAAQFSTTLDPDLQLQYIQALAEAEFLFNSCKEDRPDNLAVNLADLLEHSPRLEARAMSAILLRNLVQDELPLWNSLPEMTRSCVKSGLLNCVVNEENKPIIKILGNTISKLAADNGWPELMTFMLDRVESDDFWLKESALLIFAQLGAKYVRHSLEPHETRLILHDVFMDCLGNGGSADVRIAALSAVINFIRCLDSSDGFRFEDLLPCMFQCVTAMLNSGNEATVQKALVLLIELAKTRPNFFRGMGRKVELVKGMLQIAKAERLEEGTRHLAIEFVITFAEEIYKFPQVIIDMLCPILMRMLLDIEDEAAWHLAENEDEDAGRSSNYIFGKECLHRLATALGGNTIVPVAYEYLSAPNHKWQKHLAGLVALAQIAHSKLVKIPNLEQVVTMVSNSFQDPHPRVKWAAINAIVQFSTYVGPSLLDQYHNRVLPALDSALGDVQNPRVQACAASAVFKIKIRATCPTHMLEPYRDGILSKLIVLPETGRNIEFLRLANSLKVSTNVETRRRSAILLGKMFEEPLAALTEHLVKYILLKCVKEERERSVLKRLCHTIAMFYNAFCMKTGWPELICFVEHCVIVDSGSGQNLSYNDLLEAAMLILGPLGHFMERHHESLVEYYVWYLENANSTDIKIAAFGAAIGYIRCIHKVKDRRLVPAMTRVLTEWLNEGEEVTMQKALKLLIELAHQIKHYDTVSYGFFFSGSQLFEFVRSAIEIAESQCLKETKHLAIDFMITLGEGRKIRRETNWALDWNICHEIMTNLGLSTDYMLMITKLFGILMSYIENEVVWDDDSGELRICSVAVKFLDRLAFILYKDSVSWHKLEEYLVGAEWQECVINILALAQISKVYLKVTKKSFNQLVTMVLKLFQDSHHRVKLDAIHAIGQLSKLSTDLDQDLKYPSLVLPTLAEAIYDFENPQFQKHAASAVINISKNYPRDTLTPDLVEIVGTLLEFWEDIASDQTRILAIENLLKQFRVKLPPDTWASTRSQLLDHQAELLKILAHKEDQEEST